jgi:hypothetical protein
VPLPRIDDESAEPQTLEEILAWRNGVLAALDAQLGSVIRALQDGSPVPDAFFGLSEEGAEQYHEARCREVDRLTTFNLIASAEATVRVDYVRRVGGRLKDPLSVAYREWHKTLSDRKQVRPDFDEGGILDLLKEHGGVAPHIIGRFRECLLARHWIGHGRFWKKPPSVDRQDPNEVYERAKALLQAMPE